MVEAWFFENRKQFSQPPKFVIVHGDNMADICTINHTLNDKNYDDANQNQDSKRWTGTLQISKNHQSSPLNRQSSWDYNLLYLRPRQMCWGFFFAKKFERTLQQRGLSGIFTRFPFQVPAKPARTPNRRQT